MSVFVDVNHVTFQYHDQGEQKEVLSDISLQIKRGEFIALLGHNGCGKSTLAKHFNAMLLPSSGTVFIDGICTNEEENKYIIRQKVGLVLQNPDNQIVASVIEEDVAFGPENLGLKPEKIRERVDYALKAVDMYEYREQAPHKLSGGQKQRIAIAGILAMQPDCLVLDEPTAMLDPKGREEVLQIIQRLNRDFGITVILITHYMDEAVLADRIIVIDHGRMLMQGTPREVFCQVEKLKRHQLDVPQSTDLIYRLNSCGYLIPEVALNESECVEILARLLEGKL